MRIAVEVLPQNNAVRSRGAVGECQGPGGLSCQMELISVCSCELNLKNILCLHRGLFLEPQFELEEGQGCEKCYQLLLPCMLLHQSSNRCQWISGG